MTFWQRQVTTEVADCITPYTERQTALCFNILKARQILRVCFPFWNRLQKKKIFLKNYDKWLHTLRTRYVMLSSDRPITYTNSCSSHRAATHGNKIRSRQPLATEIIIWKWKACFLLFFRTAKHFLRSISSLGAITVIQNKEDLRIIHAIHKQHWFPPLPCENVYKIKELVRSLISAAMTTIFWYWVRRCWSVIAPIIYFPVRNAFIQKITF